MRNNAKVSIIVPVYNTESYLSQCLDSLINQTFRDMEIICVNDGSTDGSLDILKNYASKDGRVAVFDSVNKGAGGARNIGLSHSNSEYIMFVDSDDYIDKNTVEIFYSKMTENDVDLVVGHISCVTTNDRVRKSYEKYEKYYKSRRKKEGVNKLKKIDGLRSGPVAKLFKKSIITSKDIIFPERIIQEDEVWHWSYMSHVNKYYFLRNSYYYRLVREDSVMGKKDLSKEGGKDMLAVLEHIYSYLNKHGLYSKFEKQYSHYFYTHTPGVYNRMPKHQKEPTLQAINDIIKKQQLSMHTSPAQHIFSIRNEINYKIIRILGIKIKLRNKNHMNYIPFIQYIFSVRNEGNYKVIRLFGAKIKIIKKNIKSKPQHLSGVDEGILKFKTFYNLTDTIRENIPKLPSDYDLIIGIPRSGIIPAYMIALFMNKNVCSLNEFVHGIIPGKGGRPVNGSNGMKKILVVDDSVYSGKSIQQTREMLEPFTRDYSIDYLAVYTREEAIGLVDYFFEIVSMPRLFQWNYRNHPISSACCFDMDGVICVDPTDEQNDDGEKYIDFILNAKPLYIPVYTIHSIVTSRLEKYRPQTEEWLRKHNVKYENLYMMNVDTAEERRKLGNHAKFKASIYKKLEDTICFIESEPQQARTIAELSGKQCICSSTDEFFEY